MEPMSTAVIGAPEFRARSGRKVQVRENGTVTFDHANGYLSPESAMDAEEFFLAQRDIELGRWRWELNLHYVVYVDGDRVVVVDERNGDRSLFSRSLCESTLAPVDPDGLHAAAHAYYVANPERKPWQEAKPGEVWLITYEGVEVAGVADRLDFNWSDDDGTFVVTRRHDSLITAGRRIFPADAS